MKPMLAKAIRPTELDRYVKNDDWLFQPKMDGHRKLVVVDGGNVRVLNRKGEDASFQLSRQARVALDVVAATRISVILDGESMENGSLHLFDVPQCQTVVTVSTPYVQRYAALTLLVEQLVPDKDAVRVVPNARTTDEKLALVKRSRDESGEGLILRRLKGRYMQGRSDHLLKCKWINFADCVVMERGRDGKDNLVLGVYDDRARLMEIGKVTALNGDGPSVQVGQVVTVQYLGLYQDRLVQPTLPRIRRDKPPADCDMGQLVSISKSAFTL